MEDRFSLLLSLKTQDGFEVFGEFGIGEDRVAAADLFDNLQGDENLNHAALLHIDLMERTACSQQRFVRSPAAWTNWRLTAN